MKRWNQHSCIRLVAQLGSTSTEYALLSSVALILILPIVSMVKATDKSFENYAVALCGGGSDSTIATTDDNCYERYLHNLGGKKSTKTGRTPAAKGDPVAAKKKLGN